MNGPQDLGGQSGFGPIAPERDEPLFHHDWEKRALALTLAAGAMGHWTIDESRHARESRHPADYYGSSYYEIWTKALEVLLVRHGLVTPEELARGHGFSETTPPKKVLRAEDVDRVLATGGPTERRTETQPRFQPGARVRTLVMHPPGHTRLPRYARGKVGTIESVQGFHVFPDSHAHGSGEAPQWLYAVVFEAQELWGRDADRSSQVSIDAWESYLDDA